MSFCDFLLFFFCCNNDVLLIDTGCIRVDEQSMLQRSGNKSKRYHCKSAGQNLTNVSGANNSAVAAGTQQPAQKPFYGFSQQTVAEIRNKIKNPIVMMNKLLTVMKATKTSTTSLSILQPTSESSFGVLPAV